MLTLDPPIRRQFLEWQCRLRKHAMRHDGGRPSAGMRPRVLDVDGKEVSPAITVLLLEKDSEVTTDRFRHIVRKTDDPRQRYEEGLRVLASQYYEDPDNFVDVLTGLFSARSRVAAELTSAKKCILEFREDAQAYRLPCMIRELHKEETAYQATYWHNRLFNPAPPAKPRVLAFLPEWLHGSSSSDPQMPERRTNETRERDG